MRHVIVEIYSERRGKKYGLNEAQPFSWNEAWPANWKTEGAFECEKVNYAKMLVIEINFYSSFLNDIGGHHT